MSETCERCRALELQVSDLALRLKMAGEGYCKMACPADGKVHESGCQDIQAALRQARGMIGSNVPPRQYLCIRCSMTVPENAPCPRCWA